MKQRLSRHRRSFAFSGGIALLWAVVLPAKAQAHEVTTPKPILQPAPAWPNDTPESHDVVVPVTLTVSAEGAVTDASLEASVGEAFDVAALEAARHFTFQPATSEGKPVAAKVRALVRFKGSKSTRELASIEKPKPKASSAQAARALSTEVEVVGERRAPARSASETTREKDVILAAPHRTGGDVLSVVPGVFITQHSGQGKAYQVFYRGFDAVHGQDLEFWVGGAPVNEVSNIHGQGYADLHFVMPEVVSRVTVLPGNYSPGQGDFAIAGTVRYELGYVEPGITAKATTGSFGERRVFMAYHRDGQSPQSFGAFEAQSTDGFGPARAASRTSGIVQQVFKIGDGQLRVLATGYAGRFDSPGVVRLAELESGAMGRWDTYGISQGGFSTRYQWVTEYSGRRQGDDWAIAPYAILRSLKLKQNYTGYLLDENNGDTTQLLNESTTLGVTGHYRHKVRVFSKNDSVEAGVSLRNDWITQSQLGIASGNERVLGTLVDAKIRALDAAGWLDLSVSPTTRIKLRGGLRVDGLAYLAQNNTPPSGSTSTAMGTHFGPRVTVDGTLTRGVHALLSYGEGFRSPQARSLGDGERAPLTTVQSMEAGIRYAADGISGSLSAFRTVLDHDLVFDAATTRNENVPGSQRLGVALEFTAKPAPWFVSSGSATYTHATFTASDRQFHAGDNLPYVPQWILREDLAFTPTLGRLWSRNVTGRFGTALTGMFNRPQPYGAFGHPVVLLDALAELRMKEIGVGLDVFNLLNTPWYDSEFTFSANFNPGAFARLVPERYVTVGAPRTMLATFSLFLN